MILGLKKSTQLAFCLVVANARLQYAGMNGACDLTYWEHLHSKSMKNVQSKSIIFFMSTPSASCLKCSILTLRTPLWHPLEFAVVYEGFEFRGEGRQRREGGGQGKATCAQWESHPSCARIDWLTMWEPKAWLTSSNYDGWYQLQWRGGNNTMLSRI